MSSSGARNKCYSDSLCTALDKIGANQWMRRKYYEASVIVYITDKLLNINENGVRQFFRPTKHIFGSSIEGTTTNGLGIDTDQMLIEPNNVVEQGFEGIIVAAEKTVVVVTDMFTPPGFVKLKVHECSYITIKLQQASDGHWFMSNIYTDYYTQHLQVAFQKGKEPAELERHGPALKSLKKEYTYKPVDSIIAFHSKSWLSFNQEFFNRTRHHGWPSQETLDIMKGQGCLLVPTGHHFCKEEHRILQWRISFSFQERHLMLNLNTTQYKCYILLKLVKKCHISPMIDFTSYHCKTSLLYTIENTDIDIWKEANILKCFILCLKRIKKWSRNRICPSYFIPELNLFTGKIEVEELNKLTHILTNIIRRQQHYLQQISTDNFGKLVELYMNGSTDYENIEEKVDTQVADTLHNLLIDTALSVFHLWILVLQKISYKCSCLNMAIERHYKWMNTMQHLQTEYNMGIYQLDLWVVPHVCRFLHSSLASHLALKAVSSLNTQMKIWHTLSVAYHFWMGLQSDAHSGRMKLATFLFYTGYLSSDVLKSIYRRSTQETISVCACSTYCMETSIRGHQYTIFQNLFKASPIETLKMSTSVFIEKYVSACTIFLPTELELMLYPLQFEMHKWFGCKPNEFDMKFQTLYKCNSGLYNCATLDSKAYYGLLMIYLSGEKERAEPITMLYKCSVDDTLVHQDATWNVLGWFISTEKINQTSLMCYKLSWDYTIMCEDFKPATAKTMDNNAAKWHLALLLYRAWFNKKLVK